MDARKVILRRIYLVFLCICLFGIAILVQVFRLQFVQGKYWKEKALSLQTENKVIEASRGNVFSDNGSLLATSVPIYDVRMDAACEAISNETFDKKKQSAIFLNRRGVAQSVVCPACGATPECPNCAVSLTLHGINHLLCHYCDYREELTKRCKECPDGEPRPLGIGTELIEQDIQKLFPSSRVLRMDRDEINWRRCQP